MAYLALDLSKASTGWALWRPGLAKPIYGSKCLGSKYTSNGRVFAKLHELMFDLRGIEKYEFVFAEEPINPGQLSGSTTIKTIRLAAGLSAHAESFAEATGCRQFLEVNISTWRVDFVGRAIVLDAKRDARERKKATGRGSARDKLKALTVARCRDLGFNPHTDDEADAIGILDHGLAMQGITPPWRMEHVLLPVPEAV